MSEDWVDDETMSREETLARFEALNPELARGPRLPEQVTITSSTFKVSVGASSYGASELVYPARLVEVKRPVMLPAHG